MSTANVPPQGMSNRLLTPRSLGAVVLGLGVLVLYAPTWTYQFVNFDDPLYVTRCSEVQAGLRTSTLWWAFTGVHAKLWHPLTSLSHALDWQVFGTFAGGHHLTSVILHAANALLCYALLYGATGQAARSVAVAGLWALHPLRVESVAWVAERKDVLCGFFWLLALWAYGRHAVRESAAGVVLFTLFGVAAMLSKAMAVTLPASLLLISVWPLRRTTPWRRRIVEVLPLMLVAAAVSILTVMAQARGGAVVQLAQVPISLRFANALVSVVRYLGSMVVPLDLAVLYPYRVWSWSTVAGALTVIVGVTVAAAACRRRRPYVIVGWCWFVGTLGPVVGLIQAGEQSMADRFTYMPAIGLTVAAVWWVADHAPQFPSRIGVATGAVLVGACGIASAHQLSFWRDSESLFRRAIAVTDDNYLAHVNLGVALAERGDQDGARHEYEEALRIKPDSALAHFNVGNADVRANRVSEGEAHFERALALQPTQPEAHNGLGSVLAGRGDAEGAIKHFRAALDAQADFPEARTNLAAQLRRTGRLDEALTEYRIAVRSQPTWPDIRWGLGETLRLQGDGPGAATEFEAALRLRPGWPPAALALAWLRATESHASLRNGAVAIALAEGVRNQLASDDPRVLDTLAAAYAEAGRFPEAIAMATRAVTLAEAIGSPALSAMQTRRAMYAEGRPYHEPAKEQSTAAQ